MGLEDATELSRCQKESEQMFLQSTRQVDRQVFHASGLGVDACREEATRPAHPLVDPVSEGTFLLRVWLSTNGAAWFANEWEVAIAKGDWRCV